MTSSSFDDRPQSQQPDPSVVAALQLRHELHRRRFLQLLGGAGVLGAAGCARARPADLTPVPSTAASGTDDAALDVRSAASDPDNEPTLRQLPNRTVIVVELSGGNDGLAMLQPTDAGSLQDRREPLMAPEGDLIATSAAFGWNPAFGGLAGVGVHAAVGIGSNEPDYSHFEMEQRWWRGVSSDGDDTTTGFFGRLCDQLDIGDPVTGLSLSGGPTPALASAKSVTVGLTDPGVSWFFNQDDPWFATLRSTYAEMARPSTTDNERFAAARGGLRNAVRFAESLSEIPVSDDSPYPWSELGQQLRFAAEVLDLDAGVRVLHVRQHGYDTHTGQEWRHRELMTDLNDSLVAFVNDVDRRGLLDDTLVVTTSEFGRRVPINDGGTDHGGASTMLVCSPSSRASAAEGSTRVFGDAPSLTNLDDDNLVATARFEDYYATIAEDWFGVPASEVLPTGGDPITGLI